MNNHPVPCCSTKQEIAVIEYFLQKLYIKYLIWLISCRPVRKIDSFHVFTVNFSTNEDDSPRKNGKTNWLK